MIGFFVPLVLYYATCSVNITWIIWMSSICCPCPQDSSVYLWWYLWDLLWFCIYVFLKQSIFYGGVEIHDRHRDMRLDIDNMSYEVSFIQWGIACIFIQDQFIQYSCGPLIFQELLALEERIGNVSTGLSEEDVMKLLKQRKFSSWRLASMEYEPCCICQVSVIPVGLLEDSALYLFAHHYYQHQV
jgi:hypothetical protein